jgi:single-strand DNA-binding protein
MIELVIIGNVGGTRLHQGEKSTVLTVGIAANRKSSAGKIFTDWVSAKIWGERALALAEHLRKGQRLLVRGRPEVSAYARADGQPAAELVLHVRDVEFVGPRPNESVPAEKKPKPRRRRQATE